MKAIIVDDEPLALEVLETHLSKINNISLIGQFNNAIDANQFLSDNHVDVIFLDIEMPQFTGIDFVKTLSNPPMIVFTTAYSEYAVESYELDIADYLVKPISFDRFIKSVHKLEKLSKDKENNENDFIFVKADKKLIKINYNDILYIEGLKDYVIINTNQRRIVTLQTMKSLEVNLPNLLFKRIHRSYIVSIEKIMAVAGNTIELQMNNNQKSIPIGKNYKQDIIDIINEKKL